MNKIIFSSAVINKIKKDLKNKNYSIIKNRNFFNKSKIKKSLNLIRNNCLSKNDSRIDFKSIIKDPKKIPNYQRLLIGEFGKTSSIRSHFYRQIISPLWNRDSFELHKYFLAMCELRNILIGKPKEFCTFRPIDGLYTSSRVQYYPSGGGFMASHKDNRASNISKLSKIKNYIQIIFNMTEKKIDYKSGGAFIINNNKRILVDNFTKPGDILVYNGLVEHGVATIDSEKPLNDDRKLLNGRLVLLANFYSTRFSNPKDLK